MTIRRPPAPTGNDWKAWADQIYRYLAEEQAGAAPRRAVALRQTVGGETAAEDGVMLWDRENGYPIVSLNGEYRQVVLANGYAFILCEADQTASAINTATPIVFTSIPFGEGITLGTPASRVVFNEAGLYYLSFSAQIRSTSSNQKTIKFWPRINGVDIPGSTITHTMAMNNADIVVSRAALFRVDADDYLEAMFSVSDTALFLDDIAAVSPAPSSPAATLSVTRISA
jgi:hypothetical protein